LEKGLPKFTVEKVSVPAQTKYAVYHRAVADLKDPDDKVVIRGLNLKDCWRIQSNMGNKLVVIATRSVKEADGTYTLYLFKKENNNKEDK